MSRCICLHMGLCSMSAGGGGGQRQHMSLGAGLVGSCFHLMRVMVTELRPLEEQQFLLAAEPILQPRPNVFEDSIFSAEKILYVLNTRIRIYLASYGMVGRRHYVL